MTPTLMIIGFGSVSESVHLAVRTPSSGRPTALVALCTGTVHERVFACGQTDLSGTGAGIAAQQAAGCSSPRPHGAAVLLTAADMLSYRCCEPAESQICPVLRYRS